jgi:hypothetical protein
MMKNAFIVVAILLLAFLVGTGQAVTYTTTIFSDAVTPRRWMMLPMS